MIYWSEHCQGGLEEFWEANCFKVDWAWCGLWQRRMKMVLLWRFASEADSSSSVAEVSKVVVNWIESSSPLLGRPIIMASWREHGTSHTMGFSGLFYSVLPRGLEKTQLDKSLRAPNVFLCWESCCLLFQSQTSRLTWRTSRQEGVNIGRTMRYRQS